MIILKEMARFNETVKINLNPSSANSKPRGKNHYDMVRIYGLYNTNICNYIDIAFANVVNSDTGDCAVWMISKFTAYHLATKFDLSVLQETLTLGTTIVPYKGTSLTSVAETLWLTNYPVYLSVEYSPINLESGYNVLSRINDIIRNAKVKDISQEDMPKLDGRFLGGVSFTEGCYVEKDNLITTCLKVNFDELIQGEQMLLLPHKMSLFCGDLCHHISANTTVVAISEYGFKINCKNSYFVVNQIETTCEQEHTVFEIRYSKYPNQREVVSDHDSPNDLLDVISRLVNNRAY
jgi:hypothetical protein